MSLSVVRYDEEMGEISVKIDMLKFRLGIKYPVLPRVCILCAFLGGATGMDPVGRGGGRVDGAGGEGACVGGELKGGGVGAGVAVAGGVGVAVAGDRGEAGELGVGKGDGWRGGIAGEAGRGGDECADDCARGARWIGADTMGIGAVSTGSIVERGGVGGCVAAE